MEQVPQRWVLSNLLLNQEVRRFDWCTSAWKKSVWMHRSALAGLSAEVNCLCEWSQTHFTGKTPVSSLVFPADDSVIIVSLRCYYQSSVVNVTIMLYIIAFLSSVAWQPAAQDVSGGYKLFSVKEKGEVTPEWWTCGEFLRFISDLISRQAGGILSNLFDLTTDLTRVCAVGWFRHGYDPFTSDKIASTHCF